MGNQPKISIIVPVYNTDPFLRECLDSLLHQTFPASDYEVVAINDGSTDDSLAILRSYQQAHGNLIVHDRPHGGVSAAIEYGVLASHGEWLAFADGDDWLEVDFLETLAPHLSRPDCDLVVAHMVLHRREGIRFYRCSTLEPGFYARSLFADRIYPGLVSPIGDQDQYTVSVSRSGKLFRRRLVLKALPYCTGLEYAEDKVLVVSAVLASNGITVLDGFYPYHYRLNYKPTISKDLYPSFKAAAGAIGRIAGAAGRCDFTCQIRSFLLAGLARDVRNVVRDTTEWNGVTLSRRLRALYAQGLGDGVLPFDETGLDLYWRLVKRGAIWALRGLGLASMLWRNLNRAALPQQERMLRLRGMPLRLSNALHKHV